MRNKEEALHSRKHFLSRCDGSKKSTSLADSFWRTSQQLALWHLLPRIWLLRQSATAYDAAGVALAEALDALVLICDAKLARSHGHAVKVELVS